ncbi:hypothetical protein J437_LFUL017033, partial [Ladona fulva]
QCAFYSKFYCNTPSDNNIHRWYHQVEDTSSLCKRKSMGRPRLTEEHVERVIESFTHSPKKSVQKASHELSIPVWIVLRKLLQLRLLIALKLTDYGLHANFGNKMLLHDNEDFLDHVIFRVETTFLLSGLVNTHNVHIWGSENPHKVLQRDYPKLDIFCAISQRNVYGHFFFGETTVTFVSYLDALQQWLYPQLQDDEQDNLI